MAGTRRRVSWAAVLLLTAGLAGGTWTPAAGQAGPLRRATKRATPRKTQGQKRQGILPQQKTARPQNGPRRAPSANVNGQLLRLMQMGPEQRTRFFASNRQFQRLPAARRKAIQDRLAELDKLPEEEKELLVARYQLFSRLPQDRQASARKVYDEWRKLERADRNRVTAMVRRLRNAEQPQRERMTASPRYQSAFSEEERDLVEKILELSAEANQGAPRD